MLAEVTPIIATAGIIGKKESSWDGAQAGTAEAAAIETSQVGTDETFGRKAAN